MNDHLLDEKEDSRATIVLKDSSITITTYTKLDPEDSQSYVGFGRKIYSFLYHSEDQKIYWESISIVNKGGLNKLFFKTKKVLFKDTWNFNDNFSEEK